MILVQVVKSYPKAKRVSKPNTNSNDYAYFELVFIIEY